MTTAERYPSLATPQEWAGLSLTDQAVYVAALNALGLRLLGEQLATFEGCTLAAILGGWVVKGWITTDEAFAARGVTIGA